MVVAFCAAIVMSGCASTGGGLSPNQKTCMTIAGLVGAVAGSVGGNAVGVHNERDEDDRWGYIGAGAAVGGATGAGLGYLICGAEPAPKQAPQARATAEPAAGTAPLSVKLRGVGRDPEGQMVSYAWDLGDGNKATGASVSHTYASPGKYTARLTVTDSDGLTDSAAVPIRVAAAAPPPKPATRRIVLRGVNFELDSATIRPDAQVILQAAAESLKEAPRATVAVTGHTDSTGSEAYNQALSERRARAVVDYLVSLGIPASRLAATGAGELKPVADNATADGRAQNRRVELNVAK
jgi:outer membrane protein OmpA-like peptidoglycan-associated protein